MANVYGTEIFPWKNVEPNNFPIYYRIPVEVYQEDGIRRQRNFTDSVHVIANSEHTSLLLPRKTRVGFLCFDDAPSPITRLEIVEKSSRYAFIAHGLVFADGNPHFEGPFWHVDGHNNSIHTGALSKDRRPS